MVQFKRKKGESFEGFLRRFNKRLQQSGKIIQARKGRYRQPAKNRRQHKQSALIGLELRKKNEYLRRIGKLDDRKKRW